MAKHDLVELQERGRQIGWQDNDAKLGGLQCDLCGETFLWRPSVTVWERQSKQVDDAITYDRLWFPRRKYYDRGAGLNTGRCLSDGRTGEDLFPIDWTSLQR